MPTRPRRSAFAQAVLAGLVLLAPGAAARAQEAPDDARVRRAWSLLLPEEQDDVVSWFSAEVEGLPTLQGQLLRLALALEPSDPGLLPEDPGTTWFDPQEHAPGQPIARRLLAADDRQALAVREKILGRQPARPFPSAWRYDWGRREVVRSADFRAPQHVFELALSGHAPLCDLAEALVTKALDRGEAQLALAAFGHAYTDREGRVFPGVTLYDAWSSGTEIEMPDVDNLGLVHAITGKRGRWKAPVPASQHDELYDLVGELFADARRYRGLREALAQTFLVGTAALETSYAPHLLRLHGQWEEYGSQPADLAKVLPRSDDWADYLERWARRFDKDAKRLQKARTRVAQLDWDRTQVRALLVRILQEYGAFERTARPQPKPPKPAPGDGAGGR
jgi:hypothetical protein